MPDGSIAQQAAQHVERTEFDAECRRMHCRLVEWGLIMLKQSDFPLDEEEPQARHRVWSGRQQDAAMALHRMVIALGAQERIVLQCFYALNIASHWTSINPELQTKIEKELTVSANERLRTYAREIGLYGEAIAKWTIGAWQFRLIRERATRQVVVAEAQQPRPVGLHPCG